MKDQKLSFLKDQKQKKSGLPIHCGGVRRIQVLLLSRSISPSVVSMVPHGLCFSARSVVRCSAL